jgi:PAS domain S-box-containing protein
LGADPETPRFTYISPSVEKLLGYLPEEALHNNFQRLITPQSEEIVLKIIQENTATLLAGVDVPPVTLELDEVHKNGSVIPTEITATFARIETGKIQIVGISRDITKRKQAENQLRISDATIGQFSIPL